MACYGRFEWSRLARWRKGLAEKYTAKITYTKTGRAQITIPAPVVRLLYKPEKITFEVGEHEVIARFETTNSNTATD